MVRDYFYQFGELRSISMVPRQNCAFVCFTSRHSAENAAEKSFNKLILKGRRLKIMWGKAQGQQPSTTAKGPADPTYAPVPGLPGGEWINQTIIILFFLNHIWLQIILNFESRKWRISEDKVSPMASTHISSSLF